MRVESCHTAYHGRKVMNRAKNRIRIDERSLDNLDTESEKEK